jgi:hypothetical protein
MPTEEIHKKLAVIESQITIIVKAFPHLDGEVDYEGHRRAHEAMIRASQAQEQFWNDLKIEIVKKGVIGLLIIVIGLVATGLLVKLGLWHAS